MFFLPIAWRVETDRLAKIVPVVNSMLRSACEQKVTVDWNGDNSSFVHLPSQWTLTNSILTNIQISLLAWHSACFARWHSTCRLTCSPVICLVCVNRMSSPNLLPWSAQFRQSEEVLLACYDTVYLHLSLSRLFNPAWRITEFVSNWELWSFLTTYLNLV